MDRVERSNKTITTVVRFREPVSEEETIEESATGEESAMEENASVEESATGENGEGAQPLLGLRHPENFGISCGCLASSCLSLQAAPRMGPQLRLTPTQKHATGTDSKT